MKKSILKIVHNSAKDLHEIGLIDRQTMRTSFMSDKHTQTIVALGSNLGDRHQYLLKARKTLEKLPQSSDFCFSRIYETVAMAETPSHPYLNAVVSFNTELTPYQLLEQLMRIEKEYGRERPFINSPRTLDLDLLIYGDQILTDPKLTVPHPRLHERFFVLTPLKEIHPNLIVPKLNKSIKELEQDLAKQQRKEEFIMRSLEF